VSTQQAANKVMAQGLLRSDESAETDVEKSAERKEGFVSFLGLFNMILSNFEVKGNLGINVTHSLIRLEIPSNLIFLKSFYGLLRVFVF
jgi:hypothetical protein